MNVRSWVDNSASIGQKLGISCQGGASWLQLNSVPRKVYHPKGIFICGCGRRRSLSPPNYTGELPSPQAVNKALKGSPSYSRLTTFFYLFLAMPHVACGILFPSIGMVHAPSAAGSMESEPLYCQEVPVLAIQTWQVIIRRVYETEALMLGVPGTSVLGVAGL